MKHLLTNALCVTLIGLALLHASNRVSTDVYKNINLIVAKR